MNLLIYGLPGCGKTTQAKILSKELGLDYISIGELTRREVFQGTEMGRQIKSYWDDKVFYPKGFLKNFLNIHLPNNDFILDGYPKTRDELSDFLEMLDERNINIDCMIFISGSSEKFSSRISKRINCLYCGQPYSTENLSTDSKCICGEDIFFTRDDDRDIYEIRHNDFLRETIYVINFLKEMFRFIEVNGGSEIDLVSNNIFKKISNVQFGKF